MEGLTSTTLLDDGSLADSSMSASSATPFLYLDAVMPSGTPSAMIQYDHNTSPNKTASRVADGSHHKNALGSVYLPKLFVPGLEFSSDTSPEDFASTNLGKK